MVFESRSNVIMRAIKHKMLRALEVFLFIFFLNSVSYTNQTIYYEIRSSIAMLIIVIRRLERAHYFNHYSVCRGPQV